MTKVNLPWHDGNDDRNNNAIKVIGKVFLMIKHGPGFMVSQMHSLFNNVVDNGTLELTYEIATIIV